MKSIVLLGTGNVGTNLFNALKETRGFKVIQVYNHRKNSLNNFKNVPTTTKFEEIADADIYLIAVKDDFILNVSQSLRGKNALVIHTSGGKSIDILNIHNRRAVFYPLQTFSKQRIIDFDNLPVCIEAISKNDLKILEDLAKELKGKVYHINSAQRKSLHVAAVFVNNFTNLLYTEAEEICLKNDVPFEILLPLINETASKVGFMRPIEAQTGPALRNDREVIKAHLEQLNSQQKEIYNLLTKSIQNLHGKEL